MDVGFLTLDGCWTSIYYNYRNKYGMLQNLEIFSLMILKDLHLFAPDCLFIHHYYSFSLILSLCIEYKVAKKQYTLEQMCQVCYNFVQIGIALKESNHRGCWQRSKSPLFGCLRSNGHLNFFPAFFFLMALILLNKYLYYADKYFWCQLGEGCWPRER